jgi:hypothetical protein
MPEDEKKKIESLASKSKEGKTNYFQKQFQELTAPRDPMVVLGDDQSLITWNTAYAGDARIDHYEILRDDKLVAKIPYKPQISKTPFMFVDKWGTAKPQKYIVKVIDVAKREVSSESLLV